VVDAGAYIVNTTQEAVMTLCCGIDLHSNNHVVVVIDEDDRRIMDRRLSNNLQVTLSLLEPPRDQFVGIVVESTFNWYWLADGLMTAGFTVELANTRPSVNIKD
jgi:transposase